MNHQRPIVDSVAAVCDFRDYREICEQNGEPVTPIPEMHQWFVNAILGFEIVGDLDQRTICTMARILKRESELINELSEIEAEHGAEYVAWLKSETTVFPLNKQ
jgi:hypothetical protein